MSEPIVISLRSGQMEWRVGETEWRLEAPVSLRLAEKALLALNWHGSMEPGLRVAGEQDVRAMRDHRHLRDEQERLRANGAQFEVMRRKVLTDVWRAKNEPEPEPEPVWASPPPAAEVATLSKKAVRVVRAAERLENDFMLPGTLFDDPEEQLRYEVRHAYLMTVPPTQRGEWPFDESYVLMDQFLLDVIDQETYLSRKQIIAVIRDVVCGKVFDTSSRQVKQLGRAGSAANTRARDGAQAWRARVNTGPAARRLMWWRTPSGSLELARLAVHDDFSMPER